MGQATRVNIADIRRDCASPQAETRGRALHMLLTVLTRQPEVQPAARELFRRALDHETDAWTLTTCLTGLERLDGPDAVRPLWWRALQNPDPVIAGRIAMSVLHPSHLPMLLKVIDARPEFTFRRGAIHALGRIGGPSVLPVLLRLGNDETLQPQVVQALTTLGDPRAIPWLQPLIQSNRPLPELDERGATWTLGDIAAGAIRSIEVRSGRRLPPRLPEPATSAPQMPPPLPALAAAPSARPQRPAAWLAFVPLIAAFVQVAWMFAVIVLLFILKDISGTHDIGPAENAVGTALAFLPCAVGLLAGIGLIATGHTPRPWQLLVALVGCCGCVAFPLWFMYAMGLQW